MIGVEKNRKGTICRICRKDINGKYRVSRGGGLKVMIYYHLSCYFEWVNKQLEIRKKERKQLIRYKNHMTIEKLQENR